MSIQLGVIGCEIRIRLKHRGEAVNLSGAGVKTIKLRGRDGEVKEFDAAFLTNGEDGILTYKTESGDIDELRFWVGQAYVELSDGFKGHSRVGTFEVLSNL